jgi:hypothetical protein
MILKGSGCAASVMRLMRAYSDIDPNWLENGFLVLADGSREDFDVSDLEMFRLMTAPVVEDVAEAEQVSMGFQVKSEVERFEVLKEGVSRYEDNKESKMVSHMGFFDDAIQWTKRRLDDGFSPKELSPLNKSSVEMKEFSERYSSVEELYKDKSFKSVEAASVLLKCDVDPVQRFIHEVEDMPAPEHKVAICIPPTEGKTELAREHPLWFSDCDDLLDRFLLANHTSVGEVLNMSYEKMYSQAANCVGVKNRILLTNSPGCVSHGTYYYVFMLCKCNMSHPHKGFGFKPKNTGGKRKWPGEIVFFSTRDQRNKFVLAIAKMYYDDPGGFERYIDQVWIKFGRGVLGQ